MNATKHSTVFCTIDDKHDAVQIFLRALAIALNLVACPLVIILNALIITAIRRNRRLQTMHNILLASMAGTDLMVGVAAQPVFIAQETFHMTEGSLLVYCTITEIAVVMVNGLVTASLLHLDLIAVERYITIKYSLRYENIVTKFRVAVAIAFLWLFVLVHFVSSIFGIKVFSPYPVVIVSFSVIIFSHASVYLVCRRHMIQIRSEQVSSEATRKFLEERKAWKTTTIVIGGVVVSFLPGVLRAFGSNVFAHYSSGRYLASASFVTFSFVMLNSLLNPIIYCWRSKVIRNALLQLMKKQHNHENNA